MIIHIYDAYYPVLQNMVKSQGGEESEARDVFQDSMLIIYDKIRKDELILDCEFGTYLYAVWKNLWLKILKKKKQAYKREHDPGLMLVEEEWRKKDVDTYKEEHYILLRKHLEKLDKKCSELMSLYFQHYSYREICELMGFRDIVQVRKKKHRCKEKLKRWIRKDAYYEILLKQYKG
ncbi:MAG: sigma-70 family RNA polymerase sigma factor [Bacteroidota bacterium]|nr:sigma-70 family RNA polymerase sigma factor [Bacteroidota bacterium]